MRSLRKSAALAMQIGNQTSTRAAAFETRRRTLNMCFILLLSLLDDVGSKCIAEVFLDIPKHRFDCRCFELPGSYIFFKNGDSVPAVAFP